MRSHSRLFPHAPALVLALGLTLPGPGCRSTPPALPAPEPSVKPGVNAEYLKPEVNVVQWTERFEREGREIYDHRERIADAAGLRPGLRVADIGAGSGLFTLLFAGRVGERGRVYAVDIVPGFLDQIRARAAAAGLGNVETVLAAADAVRLPAGSVDLAFVCDTYHHFEYPQSTLASIHRALKPRGELVVVDFKRVPGVSSAWTFEHVRAGEEVFTAEIEAAGFVKTGSAGFLKDNYLLRFRKVRR